MNALSTNSSNDNVIFLLQSLDGVYVTRHSEYTIRGGKCVQVRDLKTRQVKPTHDALNKQLDALARPHTSGMSFLRDNPAVGDCLVFDIYPEHGGGSITTSGIRGFMPLPEVTTAN